MADDQLNGPTEFEDLIVRAHASEVSGGDLMLAVLDTTDVVTSGGS